MTSDEDMNEIIEAAQLLSADIRELLKTENNYGNMKVNKKVPEDEIFTGTLIEGDDQQESEFDILDDFLKKVNSKGPSQIVAI